MVSGIFVQISKQKNQSHRFGSESICFPHEASKYFSTKRR